MKTKKISKRVLKDLEAYLRVEQLMLDKERLEKMQKFVRENKIDKSFCMNVYIENHKGGKVVCQG